MRLICKLIRQLFNMACIDCNKPIQLNNCEDCDFTINTDCVDYTGDRFSFEDVTIRNGSSRTLTDIIENLVESGECRERSSKTITGDYTVLLEDTCKIILMDGAIETPEDVNYTITLPDDDSFIDKVLVFKDISISGDPTGNVIWSFDTSVKHDWQENLSTTSYNILSPSLHKMLYLAFIRVGANYQWVAISPNTTYAIERTEIADGDMLNNWVNVYQVSYIKEGKKISLEGAVTGGDGGDSMYQLPVGYRPASDRSFPSVVDGSPWTTVINITSGGLIQLNVPGSTGIQINDNIFLDGIFFYTE